MRSKWREKTKKGERGKKCRGRQRESLGSEDQSRIRGPEEEERNDEDNEKEGTGIERDQEREPSRSRYARWPLASHQGLWRVLSSVS